MTVPFLGHRAQHISLLWRNMEVVKGVLERMDILQSIKCPDEVTITCQHVSAGFGLQGQGFKSTRAMISLILSSFRPELL